MKLYSVELPVSVFDLVGQMQGLLKNPASNYMSFSCLGQRLIGKTLQFTLENYVPSPTPDHSPEERPEFPLPARFEHTLQIIRSRSPGSFQGLTLDSTPDGRLVVERSF